MPESEAVKPAPESPQPPEPPKVAPQSGAESEYRNLTAYFEKLVKYTFAAFGIVVAAGAFFLWKSVSDIQDSANKAIAATRESASQQIAKVGPDASEIARSEAQNRVSQVFDQRNIQEMIERVAKEKVGKAVDQEIEKNLAARIQSLRGEIADTGEISNAGARLRLGFRPALDTLVGKTKSSSEPVRRYARDTLVLVGSDYESIVKRQFAASPTINAQMVSAFMFPQPKTLHDFMEIIRHSDNVNWVAMSFIAFRDLTGTKTEAFDIPAAERWCAEHPGKCD